MRVVLLSVGMTSFPPPAAAAPPAAVINSHETFPLGVQFAGYNIQPVAL